MVLLEEILNWSTTNLTLWQRDAMRRLFKKQILDQKDYEDFYAMLKSAHGISDPLNRQSVPLSQEHFPTPRANTTAVILKSMRDLKYVNRIAEKQKLEFSPKGITVIYGRNSSGKSGYSRVLKRACRARDLDEIVYPDAFDPGASRNVPEAIFDIEINGKTLSLTWKRDQPPPDELATIAVFDSRCARVYLDAEQDVAYLPYGLDIVENLAQNVIPKLSEQLNQEISAINTDTLSFSDLLGDTAVGKILATLSVNTDVQKVQALATLTPEEIKRLEDLNRMLTENDPKAKATAQKLLAQRINGLISRIDVAIDFVNDAIVERVKTCDNDTELASQAETIVAKNFLAGEKLLPGTGGQIWKDLFELARRFSTEVAYLGKVFPYVGNDAKCPLCQQQLDQETSKRLQRFEEFIKQETTRTATKMRQERENVEKRLATANVDFGLDAANREELRQLNSALFELVQNFEKIIDTRKTWILNALKTHIWSTPSTLKDDPRVGLKSLSNKCLLQANDFDNASQATQRKLLENERGELQARTQLLPRLQPILELIKRIKLKELLVKCKDDLKTKAISDKAKEFASSAVTTSLKKALDSEFKALDVAFIKTKLTGSVAKGKMKHKLVLDLSIARKLDEILSEGEQRAIAISSFLAELHLAGHQGGIVFDDPVSSLDHERRKLVANRLVEEAKKRQVIVFTHDTTFLGELRDVIEQKNAEHRIVHLDWEGDQPGHVFEGLPWGHKSYGERLDALEKRQKVLEKNWPTHPNEDNRHQIKDAYDDLRATIERVIQDVVFNGVVQRYRDWINVGRLFEVVGFSAVEFKEIDRLHKVCCDITTAHDHSSAKNDPIPNPAELGQCIIDLKAVIETIKNRRKNQKI